MPHATRFTLLTALLTALLAALILAAPSVAADKDHDHDHAANKAFDVRSVASGPWSDAKTWQPRRVPRDGDDVLIAPGTRVTYDVKSSAKIHAVHVAGVLTFSREKDTSLTVGLLKVARLNPHVRGIGVEDVDDHDHARDDEAHAHGHGQTSDEPALEVGAAAAPIPAKVKAEIVLTHYEGDDVTALPAVICRPGARLDLHGAAMNRTWVEIGETAKKGDKTVKLAERVTGWRVGDEILFTASQRLHLDNDERMRDYPSIRNTSETRVITAVKGDTVTFDEPLDYDHAGGEFSAEVANLSRNVVIRSSDDADFKQRGHTMYHRFSRGAISYARFDQLGKLDTLGRYPIHFHLVGDTMRGSSVIGASITDSANRWVTVHGTQYLVVRDCVGYKSVGHGYFLEDGTEVYNVLDRNLGALALNGPRMRNQALPFDPNDGAAFWWANGRNTIVRNVASENFQYGYRYDSQKRSNFDSHLPVRQPDGSEKVVDIRTIAISRFQHNESHTEGLYSFVFAGTDGVGPDTTHPHMIKDVSVWNTHYALRAQLPTMWVENVSINDAAYGVYRPWYENHAYRNITIADTTAEPFNRGQDDGSEQHGVITVDGLHFKGRRYGRNMPYIQISDNNLSGKAESHFRNVTAPDPGSEPNPRSVKPLVNRGGGAVVKPETDKGVPIYLHDYFGPGRHAKVISTAAKDYEPDSSRYKRIAALTGDEAVVEEVTGVEFPKVLDPIDDHPPATIVTSPAPGLTARLNEDGSLTVRGTTSDNTETARVIVNGVEAKNVDFDFHQWQVTLKDVKPGELIIKAFAVDAAGNKEQTPHEVKVRVVK